MEVKIILSSSWHGNYFELYKTEDHSN